MEKAIVRAQAPRSQSGFTMTELVIGSAAFLVILTSAVMMLTQWMKTTGESDRAITATDKGAKAIGQIASDIRMATYLYHYATLSITANAALPFAKVNGITLPVVTQSGNDADLQGRTTAYFAARGGNEFMGTKSRGATNVLAMISDQPYGISQPRYIVYWVDETVRDKLVHYKVDGSNDDYYLQPLYRLEASPSVAAVNSGDDWTPRSWYTFQDLLTSSGTSSLDIDLSANTLKANYGKNLDITQSWRVTKVADIIQGPGITKIFTLRNPHPYSNASLMGPYLATVSVHTTGVRVGGYLKRRAEIFALNTQAFARNVPLPQPPEAK